MKLKIHLLLIIALSSFSFFSCSNRNLRIVKNSDSEITTLVKTMNQDSTEKFAEEEILYFFLTYIKKQLSVAEWQRFNSDFQNKENTLESLVEKYLGKSLYEIGYVLGAELEYKNQKRTMIDSFSVDFVKVWTTNKLQEREKESIKYQLDNYCLAIREILSQNPELAVKFDKNLALSSNEKKISILLVSNLEDEKLKNLKYNNAKTEFVYIRNSDSTFQFKTEINSRYFGLISSSSFLHEIAHAVVELIKIPQERVVLALENKELIYTTMDTLVQQKDIVISEGLAEYISHHYNSIYLNGNFNTVNSTVKFLSDNKSKLLSYDEISACYTGYSCTVKNRILSLYQSNSFVEFLIGKYGIERVLKLAVSFSVKIPYQEVLGKSKDELYKEWLDEL